MRYCRFICSYTFNFLKRATVADCLVHVFFFHYRQERIQNLCSVMGIDFGQYDPDPTYELTTDNVEKILAIHMRFRSFFIRNFMQLLFNELLLQFYAKADNKKGKPHGPL